jgi:hypothetical protein
LSLNNAEQGKQQRGTNSVETKSLLQLMVAIGFLANVFSACILGIVRVRETNREKLLFFGSNCLGLVILLMVLAWWGHEKVLLENQQEFLNQ